MPAKVLIAGFKHETNTFSRLPTTLDDYKARALQRGDAIATAYAGTNTEVAAFLDGCKRHGWQPILTLVADATPSGRLTRYCYEAIAGEIVVAAERERPVAVLLNLHGAMVAEQTEDGEGELIARIRASLGPKVIIAATLDLHANVTERMAREADILVSYRTYPHVDNYKIAEEAVELVARALQGEIKPATVMRRGAELAGLDSGRTTQPGPMTEALAMAEKLKAEPGVLSVSVNAGFFKADIAEVGPSVVIVGEGDRDALARHAGPLLAHIKATRTVSTVRYATVADAVALAKVKGRVGSPVVIADYADNPGGGGYSDSTGVIRGLLEAGITAAAASAICDPSAAAACQAAGLGATLTLEIGGKIDPVIAPPVRVTGTVTHLSDGRFTITGPMMTGMKVDMGPTATLKCGGLEIVIGTRRFQNYDLGFFRIGGIEPKERAVLLVKSMQHFRAAYAPIAGEIIVVDEGDGITSSNIGRLKFTKVRRPVWLLDQT
ncbi:MAG: M81 family metallopeptidase [Proteobacteria bacterium]|nr:M81 family metallopeptidase [Pseudomonadota bacterium]